MQARKTQTLLGGGLLKVSAQTVGNFTLSEEVAKNYGSQCQEYKFAWRTHHTG